MPEGVRDPDPTTSTDDVRGASNSGGSRSELSTLLTDPTSTAAYNTMRETKDDMTKHGFSSSGRLLTDQAVALSDKQGNNAVQPDPPEQPGAEPRAPGPRPEPPPGPRPGQWPGPRPAPRPERPQPPWERDIDNPRSEPRKHINELSKELGKNLDPKLTAEMDKLIEQLGSESFPTRDKATRDSKKLLENGGNPVLAHFVKAFGETKDLEVQKRLERLINPYVNRELSVPTFSEWLNQMQVPDSAKGTPHILKELNKTSAEQKERHDRLEVLAAYLTISGSSQAKEMHARIGEYKHSKEIGKELSQYKKMSLESANDSDLETLSKVAPNLETLTLSKSPDITDKGLSRLKGFDRLTDLTVEGIPITKAVLKELADIKNLKALSLPQAHLTDDRLRGLAGAQKLESLDLSDNPKVTEAGLAHLHVLQNLTELTLDRTGITDKWLDRMPALNDLNFLSVKGTKLTADALSPSKLQEKLPHLRRLVVGDQIPADKLEKLRQQLPDIRVQRIAHN